MNHFIPFARPSIGDDEISAVTNVLKSGWLTSGPAVNQFEESFISTLCIKNAFAVSVNSATSGLHLALEALGVTSGDEVITTVHTFTATAEVIRYLGAIPVFVDINLDSLCIDVDLIESCITPRTKVILPVHFAGLSCDMEAILRLAAKHNLFVVEDAAHALPTSFKGDIIGDLQSDATVFSFYANKTMTTGEGGMLITKNLSLAKRARIMRLHGINKDAFNRFTSTTPSWYYEVVAPGYKYNMTDISASIGLCQLRSLFVNQEIRESIAQRYNQAFRSLPFLLPPGPLLNDIHARHLYPLILSESHPLNRDSFVSALFNRGIGCSVHYIPLHQHPYWKNAFKLSSNQFPVSQFVYERTVSLPIYSSLTSSEVDYIIESVVSVSS